MCRHVSCEWLLFRIVVLLCCEYSVCRYSLARAGRMPSRVPSQSHLNIVHVAGVSVSFRQFGWHDVIVMLGHSHCTTRS